MKRILLLQVLICCITLCYSQSDTIKVVKGTKWYKPDSGFGIDSLQAYTLENKNGNGNAGFVAIVGTDTMFLFLGGDGVANLQGTDLYLMEDLTVADSIYSVVTESTTLNATGTIKLNNVNINTAGTLTNVAYENQENAFTQSNRFNDTTYYGAVGDSTYITAISGGFGLHKNWDASSPNYSYINLQNAIVDIGTMNNQIYLTEATGLDIVGNTLIEDNLTVANITNLRDTLNLAMTGTDTLYVFDDGDSSKVVSDNPIVFKTSRLLNYGNTTLGNALTDNHLINGNLILNTNDTISSFDDIETTTFEQLNSDTFKLVLAADKSYLTNTGTGIWKNTSLSANNTLHFTNSTTGNLSTDGFKIGSTGSIVDIKNQENAAMNFYTNGTQRMQIMAGGTVGIGTNAVTANQLLITCSLSGASQSTIMATNTATTGGGCMFLWNQSNAATGIGSQPIVSYQRSSTVASASMFGLWQEWLLDINSAGSRYPVFKDIVRLRNIPAAYYSERLFVSRYVGEVYDTNMVMNRNGIYFSQNKNWSWITADSAEYNNGLSERRLTISVNDDGIINLPNAKYGSGHLYVFNAGAYAEFAHFVYGSDGTVTLITNSGNVTTTATTDNKLNIYDNGTYVSIENKLGGARVIQYIINYQ